MLLILVPYLIIQTYAAIHLRGGWRWTALIPALPMLLICALAISMLRQDSNLWGLFPVMASPPAIVFVLGVLLVHRYVGLRRWAKWAFLVITILLGVQMVSYTSSMMAEHRSHGDPSTLYTVASDSLLWGVPLLIMLICTIALWRSEQQRRQQPAPLPAPA